MIETKLPERREGPSHAEVTFFFGAHAGQTDIIGLRRVLESVDYYCPEAELWTNETKKTLQGVSDGLILPENALKDTQSSSIQFAFALYEELYNTNVRIALVDVDSSYTTDSELHVAKPSSFLPQLTRNPDGEIIFQTHLPFNTTIERHWELQSQKEIYLARRDDRIVFNTLSMAHEIGRDPQWKSRRPRILVHLGAAHADMPQLLQDVGFLHSNATYQLKWEYPTRILETKQLLQGTGEVPLENKARYWLHEMLTATYGNTFYAAAVTSYAWQNRMYEVIDTLQIRDIEQIFTALTDPSSPTVQSLFDPTILPWTTDIDHAMRDQWSKYSKQRPNIPSSALLV